jgi:hypothetical protein
VLDALPRQFERPARHRSRPIDDERQVKRRSLPIATDDLRGGHSQQHVKRPGLYRPKA